jgi:hypothetical protein
MMDWATEAANSHYRTAVAVRQEMRAGNLVEADAGIAELIDALARSERRALRSQLVRLMAHVLKWLAQPDQRSHSWAASIYDAREEIKEIQEETPSISDDVIRAIWQKCFLRAKAQAKVETNLEIALPELTWEQVFSAEYQI